MPAILANNKFTLITLAAAIVLLAVVACQSMTPFIVPANPNDPAATQSTTIVQMNAAQLAQMQATLQGQFDEWAARIDAEKSAAAASAVAATTAAEQVAATTRLAAVAAEQGRFRSQIDALNAKLDSAQKDLEIKRAQTQSIFAALVNTASRPPTDPAGWITTILGIGGALIGAGAFADSRSKSKIISRLKEDAGTETPV